MFPQEPSIPERLKMFLVHHTKDGNEANRSLVDRIQSLEALAEESSKTLQLLETSPLELHQEISEELRAFIEEARKVIGEMRAISGLQQKDSDLQKSFDNRRQRIPDQGQELSDEHREEMQSHAAGLEKFGSDENPANKERLANYHVIHEGNIRKDEEALCYLAQYEPHRLKHASKGFEILYNLSISEYDSFQISIAPDEIINALNKKSDMNHFHFSITRRNPQLKVWIVSICDSIIKQWKRHSSSSGKEELLIENIRNQNRCLETEIGKMF